MMSTEAKDLDIEQFNNLLKEIAQNAKEGLDDFYNIYGKLIYSVAMTVSKSTVLADEIANEVLFKVWQLSSKPTDISNPASWMYVVTKHCAIDKLKSEKHTSEIFDVPEHDKNIESIENDSAFYYYLSWLDIKEQQIIILHLIQGLSFKSIAEELGKRETTVSSIYYRALKKLKSNKKIF